jgi:hypothetical protein
MIGGNALAAAKHPAHSLNRANDELMRLPEPQQAAKLARAVGHWCIGTKAFMMGLVTAGRGKGNAYWSLRCADGSSWAVQLDPEAGVTAIDCESFKESALGKECFKKF